MGSVSYSQKRPRTETSGWASWQSMSGWDYIDVDSFNLYCVAYKANVNYGSGETLTGLTAGVSLLCTGSVFAINNAVVTCSVYTSDPTGGSALPSPSWSKSETTQITNNWIAHTFSFDGLSFTGPDLWVVFTAERPAEYGTTAHTNADAGSATISGSFNGQPPAPSLVGIDVTADNGYSFITPTGYLHYVTRISDTHVNATAEKNTEIYVSSALKDGYTFNDCYDTGSGTVLFTVKGGHFTITRETFALLRSNTTLALQSGTGISSVSGEGTYLTGSTCSISAAVQSGYEFEGWFENDVLISASPSLLFQLTGPRTLEARGKRSGGIRIRDGLGMKVAVPYIFSEDSMQWQRYIPEVRNNDQWKISS